MEVIYLSMPAETWDAVRAKMLESYALTEKEVFLMDDVKIMWRGVPEE